MRTHYMLTLAISVSLVGAMPAWAYQGGIGNAQRGGNAAPTSQPSTAVNSTKNQVKARDTVYGSQMMTPAERSAYRTHMRSLKTTQQREAFRKQHHEQMQKRASERGMKLPDTVPRQGGGMGPGNGMRPRGARMGPGAGMAPAGMNKRALQQTRQTRQTRGKDQPLKQKQGSEPQTPQPMESDGN